MSSIKVSTTKSIDNGVQKIADSYTFKEKLLRNSSSEISSPPKSSKKKSIAKRAIRPKNRRKKWGTKIITIKICDDNKRRKMGYNVPSKTTKKMKESVRTTVSIQNDLSLLTVKPSKMVEEISNIALKTTASKSKVRSLTLVSVRSQTTLRSDNTPLTATRSSVQPRVKDPLHPSSPTRLFDNSDSKEDAFASGLRKQLKHQTSKHSHVTSISSSNIPENDSEEDALAAAVRNRAKLEQNKLSTKRNLHRTTMHANVKLMSTISFEDSDEEDLAAILAKRAKQNIRSSQHHFEHTTMLPLLISVKNLRSENSESENEALAANARKRVEQNNRSTQHNKLLQNTKPQLISTYSVDKEDSEEDVLAVVVGHKKFTTQQNIRLTTNPAFKTSKRQVKTNIPSNLDPLNVIHYKNVYSNNKPLTTFRNQISGKPKSQVTTIPAKSISYESKEKYLAVISQKDENETKRTNLHHTTKSLEFGPVTTSYFENSDSEEGQAAILKNHGNQNKLTTKRHVLSMESSSFSTTKQGRLQTISTVQQNKMPHGNTKPTNLHSTSSGLDTYDWNEDLDENANSTEFVAPILHRHQNQTTQNPLGPNENATTEEQFTTATPVKIVSTTVPEKNNSTQSSDEYSPTEASIPHYSTKAPEPNSTTDNAQQNSATVASVEYNTTSEASEDIDPPEDEYSASTEDVLALARARVRLRERIANGSIEGINNSTELSDSEELTLLEELGYINKKVRNQNTVNLDPLTPILTDPSNYDWNAELDETANSTEHVAAIEKPNKKPESQKASLTASTTTERPMTFNGDGTTPKPEDEYTHSESIKDVLALARLQLRKRIANGSIPGVNNSTNLTESEELTLLQDLGYINKTDVEQTTNTPNSSTSTTEISPDSYDWNEELDENATSTKFVAPILHSPKHPNHTAEIFFGPSENGTTVGPEEVGTTVAPKEISTTIPPEDEYQDSVSAKEALALARVRLHERIANGSIPGVTSPAELTAAEELRLLEEMGYIDDDEKFGKGNITTTTEKVVPSTKKSSLVISEIGDYYEDDPGKSTPNISHPTEANLKTTPVSTTNNVTESVLKIKEKLGYYDENEGENVTSKAISSLPKPTTVAPVILSSVKIVISALPGKITTTQFAHQSTTSSSVTKQVAEIPIQTTKISTMDPSTVTAKIISIRSDRTPTSEIVEKATPAIFSTAIPIEITTATDSTEHRTYKMYNLVFYKGEYSGEDLTGTNKTKLEPNATRKTEFLVSQNNSFNDMDKILTATEYPVFSTTLVPQSPVDSTTEHTTDKLQSTNKIPSDDKKIELTLNHQRERLNISTSTSLKATNIPSNVTDDIITSVSPTGVVTQSDNEDKTEPTNNALTTESPNDIQGAMARSFFEDMDKTGEAESLKNESKKKHFSETTTEKPTLGQTKSPQLVKTEFGYYESDENPSNSKQLPGKKESAIKDARKKMNHLN